MKFIRKYIDIEFYFWLYKEYENNEDKKNELIKVLNNVPKVEIKIKKNNLGKINPKNYDKKIQKLIVLNAIIEDDIKILRQIKDEEYLKIIIDYNEIHKDKLIKIKNGCFKFYIEKMKNNKKIYRYCDSIPALFDFLKNLDSNTIQGLTIENIPNISRNDNLINLIEDYEKIENCFTFKEIIKLWRHYINCYYKENFEQLIVIYGKLGEMNNEIYNNFLEEIKGEIVNLGKSKIKSLKSKDMYEFFNKYNELCDFFSDDQLITIIAKNICLKDLNNDNIFKEFKDCKFLRMINGIKYKYFYEVLFCNTFSKFSLDDFYILFKKVYHVKEIEEENNCNDNNNNDKIISKVIITNFSKILNENFSYNLKLKEEYKEVFQLILILSIKYLEDNNYQYIIEKLFNNNLFDEPDVIDFFIVKFFNFNIEIYISNEQKDLIIKYILNNFLLKNKEIIKYLPRINSRQFKEDYIYKTFPILQFDDILSREITPSFSYFMEIVDTEIITKENNITYIETLIENCRIFKEKLQTKEINYSNLIQLKDLKLNGKLLNKINYICLKNKKESDDLEKLINDYIEKYLKYINSLDKIIFYYNKYYPISKKEEIKKFQTQQLNIKQSKLIKDIQIDGKIYADISKFKKYEKSKFFELIFDSKIIKNSELNEEFIHLKDYFKLDKSLKLDKFIENFKFLKYKENICNSLNSLLYITKVFKIERYEDFSAEITQLINNINKIEYFSDIENIINKLKNSIVF